jgi:uncharacterized protein
LRAAHYGKIADFMAPLQACRYTLFIMSFTAELPILSETVRAKERVLRSRLRDLAGQEKQLLIAFSGGVDSAFLLHVAHQELGERAVACLGISPSLMDEEREEAVELAAQIGVPLRLIETHEMDDLNYAANPSNRCYFCKSHLFDNLRVLAASEDYAAICDGTNLDDLQEWRPGARAGSERGIVSPLREAQLNKEEIRLLSRHLNLPTWDKPAMPCLASRIPYGTPVTPEALRLIGQSEAFLRRLGLREIRVRHHVDGERYTARLEVAPEEMPHLFAHRDEVAKALRDYGYHTVTLDLEGYRRGKLNDVPEGAARPAPQPISLFL